MRARAVPLFSNKNRGPDPDLPRWSCAPPCVALPFLALCRLASTSLSALPCPALAWILAAPPCCALPSPALRNAPLSWSAIPCAAPASLALLFLGLPCLGLRCPALRCLAQPCCGVPRLSRRCLARGTCLGDSVVSPLWLGCVVRADMTS